MRGDMKPDVCVIGLGYIGLPTAAVIARAGCPVHGVDVFEEPVRELHLPHVGGGVDVEGPFEGESSVSDLF